MKISGGLNHTNLFLDKKSEEAKESLQKIGSGKQLSSRDAAIETLAQMMMSDANVVGQGIQNANESIAMLQIAEGALQNISEVADRLNVLNVRAGSASLNQEQQAMLREEFQRQVEVISQSMENATYNGKRIFGNSFTTSIGHGEIGMRIPKLQTDVLTLGDEEGLKKFRSQLDEAISAVGSSQNAFKSAIESLMTSRVNTKASYSQMADTDIAKEIQDFIHANLQSSVAMTSIYKQEAIDRTRVLSLLS